MNRFLSPFMGMILFLISSTAAFGAPGQTIVGVVTDGPSLHMDQVIGFINEEIQHLAKNEFVVRLNKEKRLNGGWRRRGIESALSRLYQDPQVDIVLALGFGSAAVAVSSKAHPKPTIASVILYPHLVNAPVKAGVSGKHNLTYINIQADLETELKTFRRIVDFKNLAILSDALMLEVMPALSAEGAKVASKMGIKIFPVLHGKEGEDLVSRLPAGADAVLIGALPRMNEAQTTQLLDDLGKRGLPSYSLTGQRLVEQGALATAVPLESWQRRTRRLALNIQAILFGDDPGDMKVAVEDQRRMVINMKTARRLQISPPIEVLLDAEKLNEEPETAVVHYTLSRVAGKALVENLGIRASNAGVEAGSKRVDEARAHLFPKLTLGAVQQVRDDSSHSVATGGAAEQQGNATLSLSQVVFNESTWANLDIAKADQTARVATAEQIKLDTIQDAATAFLNVLKSNSLKKIHQANLELSHTNLGLARVRAKIGSATLADVYRWESEVAHAKANLLSATAALNQEQESLNRLLNRPLTEAFSLEPAALTDENLVMNNSERLGMLGNRAGFQSLSEIMIREGLDRSPEIALIMAEVVAQKRNFISEKRSFWMPTLTLTGEYLNTYHDSRSDALSLEGEDEWYLGLNMSLPLFEGGARSKRVTRAHLTLNKLRLELKDTTNAVEQMIRSRLHTAQASKASIDLNRTAAKASRKNFDLVQDAYTKGTTGVVDLVDAQNSYLTAELTASNAVYQYLIDLVSLQRATGSFDFLTGSSRHDTEPR